MIPINKLFERFKLSNTKTNSPNQKANIKIGDNNHVNFNQNVIQQTQNEQDDILSKLRDAWILNNDGISPERMVGIGWGKGEKVYINQKLEEMNHSWRV